MVEFRDATPADAHAVATVIVQSWRIAYRGQLPDDVLADLSVPDRERLWSEILIARPQRTRTVVAAIGPVIVGVVATGPPLVPTDRSDPAVGDLYALYLNSDLWGRGLGTQLHTAALNHLRSNGFTHAGLWVLATDERALRFYNRHGWIDTGRTQVDRGPGDVELHERRLCRSLTSKSKLPR